MSGARSIAARQGLPPAEPFASPAACARALVCIRAAESTTPFLAIRARCARFDPDALDRAFAALRWVRVRGVRGTLHCGPVEACAAMVRATRPVGAELERLLRAARSDGGAYERARAEALEALAHGPLPEPALVGRILARGGGIPRLRIRALVQVMLRDGTLVSWKTGSWREQFPRRYGGALREAIRPNWFARAPFRVDEGAAAARAELVGRYLAGYGPATLDDVARWTGFGTRASARVLTSLERGGSVVGTAQGWDARLRARAHVGVPRRGAVLLPAGDCLVKAYDDLSRLV